MPYLAIQAASSQRVSSTDRLSVMPGQFLQAVVIGLARPVAEGVAEEVHTAPLEGRFGQRSKIAVDASPKGAASPCIFVRCNSQSSGGVRFVLTSQWFIIPPCSGRFAECRRFCCDSVATDGTNEG
jgi:hypothetical protein